MADSTLEPTEAELEQLKGRHGRLVRLEAVGQVVYVKRATREVYKRFRAQASDEAKRPVAAANLVAACLVWPEKAEAEALFDEYPGLVDTIGGSLLELAGVTQEVEKKAL